MFINCTDRQLREELNSGRTDLAFLITDSIRIPDVNVHMLKTENLILATGPTYPLAARSRIELTDLNGQTVLLPRTD